MITTSVVVAAARGILMVVNKSLLVEFGVHINLSRHCASLLLSFGSHELCVEESHHVKEQVQTSRLC